MLQSDGPIIAATMMFQYLYISTAPDLSLGKVDAILETSRRNNQALGVTGLLLYNGNNFMQLLEGEPSALSALMRRIGTDSRHSGVSMLHSGKVAERICGEWAMKRLYFGDNYAERHEKLNQDLPAALDSLVRQVILNFAVLN